MLFELFEQQHLMHIIARQPVRGGQHQPVNASLPNGIAYTVQPGTIEPSAAIAVIPKDQLLAHGQTLLFNAAAKSLQLLLNGLMVNLAGGRHPYIHGNSHHAPPFLVNVVRLSAGIGSTPTPSGTPDPSAVARPAAQSSAGE
jgi:hypothetical protein